MYILETLLSGQLTRVIGLLCNWLHKLPVEKLRNQVVINLWHERELSVRFFFFSSPASAVAKRVRGVFPSFPLCGAVIWALGCPAAEGGACIFSIGPPKPSDH